MKYQTIRFLPAVVAVILALTAGVGAATLEPQTSPRMERAKDFIADEQWLRAIEQLKGAAVDPKEKSQDEALFWLAHSQHQAGHLSDAVSTIRDLEQKFPTSRWVKPARSLRVELAQKLRRADVLWWTATTVPAPAPAPAPAAVSVPVEPATRVFGVPARTPARPRAAPAPEPVGAAPLPPPGTEMPPPRPAAAGGRRGALPPFPPQMPAVWVSDYTAVDTDLRIQALGSLIKTDAPRVIPILRDIALSGGNPNEASRAVFVLAQCGRADAHSMVLEVARLASEPVSVAAVRELGRFGGPHVADDLLRVYASGKPRVKYQVVSSLGERSATMALFQIVQSEVDSGLRDVAIITLGQAGGREQLQRLYKRAGSDVKRPIITGLFNARAEGELIEIAERETDPLIRREVLMRLRLLGTPKAKEYLEKTQASR